MGKTIIMIGHKKRQGKDTFANMVAEIAGGKVLRFAGPLKEIIADTFNISLPELEELKNEEVTLIHGHYHWHKEMVTVQTYRDVLQRFGTEAMKKQFGSTVWAELMVRRINEAGSDVIIIPDFRFYPEYETLSQHFSNIITVGIVRGNRLCRHTHFEDTHTSETALDDFDYDITIHNTGRLSDLKFKAVNFVKQNLL